MFALHVAQVSQVRFPILQTRKLRLVSTNKWQTLDTIFETLIKKNSFTYPSASLYLQKEVNKSFWIVLFSSGKGSIHLGRKT